MKETIAWPVFIRMLLPRLSLMTPAAIVVRRRQSRTMPAGAPSMLWIRRLQMTEVQVRERVGELAQAVAAKDIDRLMSFYGPDIVSFDINPPLRYSGTERKRHAWQDVFTLYAAGPL